MRRTCAGVLMLTLVVLACGPGVRAQRRGADALTGVYRINVGASDKLYSVVAGASADLPFAEQQRFFIDLAVRLTPPDLLAIERRGRSVTIGSSRSPRVTLAADGVSRAERGGDGRLVRSRATLEGDKLVFASEGRAEDAFTVIFASVEAGRRLRVTRRLSAENLQEPVVIQTVYDKISDSARWDIYGEPLRGGVEVAAAPPAATTEARPPMGARPPEAARASDEAAALVDALGQWVGATIARDLERQMSFYAPRLRAFYLTRDVPRSFVRAEKARAFSTADVIDIRAEQPEIIFRDAGRTAVMRFRKSYRIEHGRRSRRGQVVQELWWRREPGGWKILSERDVKVIR